MWRILPTATIVGFVALLVVAAVTLVTSNITPALAQTAGATTAIRVLDFNTEGGCFQSGCPGDDDWASRNSTCPVPMLQYSMDKTRFLARYLREKKIDIGAFQEVNGRCPSVPLKRDVFNRAIPDLPDDRLAAIAAFKAQFKEGYEKTTGKRFATDAQFEAELSRVLGKKTFEDVWVRFLPFDESFWTAMQLIYVEGYPMQAVAKPYAKDTQWFRTVTYSRFPLARALTSADYIPIIYNGEQLNSDSRWFSRAPISSPFGLLNFYNVHTRAGEESCNGAKTAFKTAQDTYTTDSRLYMLAGDFNQTLKGGDCDSGIRSAYNLADWGESTAIDYLALNKLLPLKFDAASRQVLYARGGEQQEGATISQHNGFSYLVTGPKTADPPPLTNVTLPDYLPHTGESSSNQSPTVQPPTNTAGTLPLCSDINQGKKIETTFQPASPVVPSPTCADGSFNMVRYMKGTAQNTLHTTDDQYKTVLDGTINGRTGFYIVKNRPGDVFEEFTVDGQYIYHLKDTSWATANGNVQCNGSDAGFTLIDGCMEQSAAANAVNTAQEGAKWFPVCMQAGQEYAFPTTVVGFDKSSCTTCNAPFTGCGVRTVKITEAGINGQITLPDGQKSVPLTNAIRVEITGGPGAGENYIYDPEYGWIGFGRTAQITSIAHEVQSKLSFNNVLMCKATPGTPPRQCITPDEYYIQPINGVNGTIPTRLTAENPTGNQLDVIRDELIMQGYEARCATPGFSIKLTEDGRDAMEKLFQQPAPYFNGVVVGGGDGGGASVGGRTDSTARVYSRLDVDYRDILVPLFRDLDRSNPQLKRSIEDYFGHKETSDGFYPSAELKTAAINSLLSNQQRCTVAYQNLAAQDAMCKKLADPNQCALYATTIPNTNYTIRSLFDAFEAARGNTPVIDFCNTVMGSSTGPHADLRRGMANAPLTIEKAYRLAFMVTSVHLRLPNPTKLLNLFTHPLGGWLGPPMPKEAVSVVAFKIPDILTNKGFNDGYTTDTAYEDTGTLTKNSLLTEKQQAEIDEEALARRRRLLEKARSLADVVQHESWAEIACLGGGTKTSGVGSPQCKDPLSKALVDIINAQAVLYKDLVAAPTPSRAEGPLTQQQAEENAGAMTVAWATDFGSLLDAYEDDAELSCDADFETARTINDPGVINAPNHPSHVFTQNYGAALLANLFGDCTHDGAGNGSPSFASTQDPDSGADCGEDWFLKSKFFVIQPDPNDPLKPSLAGSDSDDALAVKHFLVYPTGYELRTVEGVLAGSFFTKTQLEDILELQKNSPAATEKIIDQFRLEDGKVVFNGGSGGYSYTDRVNCEKQLVYQPDTGTWVEIEKCHERSFGFRLFSTTPKAANILGGTLGYWMRKIQLTLNATTQKSFDYLKTCASLEEFMLDRCGGGTTGSLPPGQSINVPPGSGSWVGDRCTSSTTLEEIKYTQETNLPFTGKATYYGSSKFNETLNTRLSGAAGNDFKGNTTVKNCELPGATIGDAKSAAAAAGQEYVGCVALLRMGDLYFRTAWNQGSPNPNAIRSVWLKNKDGVVHGPFAVIDVAAEHHAACLYDDGWAVDIDFNSFKRLFGQTGGPDTATVCSSESC